MYNLFQKLNSSPDQLKFYPWGTDKIGTPSHLQTESSRGNMLQTLNYIIYTRALNFRRENVEVKIVVNICHIISTMYPPSVKIWPQIVAVAI